MWWVVILAVLGAIIVLIAFSIIIGSITFKRKVDGEVKKLLEQSKDLKPKVVTEEDIRGLPEPVQRYLRYTQAVGKEKTRTVRLKQKGTLRQREGQNWMPFEAEQYYTTEPPGFIWYATAKSGPLWVKARDMFYEGKGSMSVKLLSLLKVVDASGPEMNQGALVRYLNEAMWFPTAYLSDYIRWEPLDFTSAKATVSVKGVTASATLYFNENGELTNFVAERYKEEGGKFSLRTWSTPIQGCREINGIRIPYRGYAAWNLSSGEFKYIELEITDIEYNNL